jgi:hypothetical protein
VWRLKLSWRLRELVQTPQHLHLRLPFAFRIKILCRYLVVLPPEAIQSIAVSVRVEKMPDPLHSIPYRGLGAFVKVTDSTLWQLPNLFADGNAIRVLGISDALPNLPLDTKEMPEPTQEHTNEQSHRDLWGGLKQMLTIAALVLGGLLRRDISDRIRDCWHIRRAFQQFNTRENFPTKFMVKPKPEINSQLISFTQVGRGRATLGRSAACMGIFERQWAKGCKVFFTNNEPHTSHFEPVTGSRLLTGFGLSASFRPPFNNLPASVG